MSYSTRSTWTNAENVILIDFYEKHRLLWDPKDESHNDSSKTSLLLNKLSKLLEGQRSTLEIKNHFKALKDYMRKEDKKIYASSQLRPDNIYVSRWPWFNKMLFLREVFENNESMPLSNMKRRRNTRVAAQEFDEMETDSSGGRPSDHLQRKKKYSSPAIKTFRNNNRDVDTTYVLRNASEDDEFERFGRVVADSLRALDPADFIEAKHAIEVLLHQYRKKSFENSIVVNSF